jgi:signal transduction histidine kinase
MGNIFKSCVFLLLLPLGLNAQSITVVKDSLRVELYNQQAWQHKNTAPDTARQRALAAIELAEEINFPKGIADGLHILGMVQWSRGDRASALDYYLQALAIRQVINDSLGLGRSFNNIGNVYFSQENYDSALVYYQQGRDIRKSLRDIRGLIYSLSNLGDVALKMDDIPNAEQYYHQGEQLALRENVATAIAHIKSRLGRLSLQVGDETGAQENWEEALSFAEQSTDRRLIASCLLEVVRLMMLNQKEVLPQQEAYARRGLELAAATGALDLQTEAAMLLAQLSALKGDFDQVFYYQAHYRQLVEELVEKSKNDAITAIQTSYTLERQADEELAAEKRIGEELSAKNTRLLFGLLLSGILLLVVLSFSTFLAYRKQFAFTQTLEVKNKELDARYSDLREFAKIASHDLKEPVRNIGAFANLLQRRNGDSLDADSREYLAFIVAGAKNMNELLSDLQLFTDLASQANTIHDTIQLSPLLRELFNKQAEEQKKPDAQLVIGNFPNINGHPELLKILFEQLFQNALKFAEAEAPQVEVSYLLRGKHHQLAIKDQGIGIEKEYQAQIFDIFQRLHKQNFAGTGMGLAICRRIVELHQGRIWLESTPGQGSTFFVELPAW